MMIFTGKIFVESMLKETAKFKKRSYAGYRHKLSKLSVE